MEKHIVEVKSITHLNQNVLKIITKKPEFYRFSSGQATTVSINKKGLEEENMPFTFTNLSTENDLEFITKIYPEQKSTTNALSLLAEGDELILHQVFGTIVYNGEGVFIAGGAGVTPFISILRLLKSKNRIGSNTLILANKTEADIILHEELKRTLGANFISILSEEEKEGHMHGLITHSFLEKMVTNLNQKFYICGPIAMVTSVRNSLLNIGIHPGKITTEDKTT